MRKCAAARSGPASFSMNLDADPRFSQLESVKAVTLPTAAGWQQDEEPPVGQQSRPRSPSAGKDTMVECERFSPQNCEPLLGSPALRSPTPLDHTSSLQQQPGCRTILRGKTPSQTGALALWYFGQMESRLGFSRPHRLPMYLSFSVLDSMLHSNRGHRSVSGALAFQR